MELLSNSAFWGFLGTIIGALITGLTSFAGIWLTNNKKEKLQRIERFYNLLAKKEKDPIKSARDRVLEKYIEFRNKYISLEEAEKEGYNIDSAMEIGDEIYLFADEVANDKILSKDAIELTIYYKSIMKYDDLVRESEVFTDISYFYSIMSDYFKKYEKSDYKVFYEFFNK